MPRDDQFIETLTKLQREERRIVARRELMRIGRELLHVLGRDPSKDPAVEDTPRRFADSWLEFIDYDPGRTDTAFEHDGTRNMVIVSGIRVWSRCEHHLIPFWCDVTMAYKPNGKVLGLSKLARIAQQHAHKLQLQERLTLEIADHIRLAADTTDVAVYAVGEHLCMSARGVSQQEARTTTIELQGAFEQQPELRSEFLAEARGAR